MKLVITIDTEEDNWGQFSPTDYTLENISRIPILQALFDEFMVKPTYLVTFPVANNENSVAILKPILDDGKCEIGTHCHPWNTPPFEELISDRNSMLCNLPSDLQCRKITSLHNSIIKNFGIKPTSFRAGRWGYSSEVAANIYKLGYKIDTSVTPYTNWSRDDGPDFTDISPMIFKFSMENILQHSSNGHMLEVPVSIGFFQENFSLSNFILKILQHKPISYLKITGMLYWFHIINKAWLSPEFSDSKTMIKLAKTMNKNKFPLINMVFHSSTLKAGKTPYVKTESDEKSFFKNIREFLAFAKNEGIESITLSEAGKIL